METTDSTGITRACVNRPLGRSGIEVSPLGFGRGAIGGEWGAPDGQPLGRAGSTTSSPYGRSGAPSTWASPSSTRPTRPTCTAPGHLRGVGRRGLIRAYAWSTDDPARAALVGPGAAPRGRTALPRRRPGRTRNARPLRGVGAAGQAVTSDGPTLAQGTLGRLWARSLRTAPIPGFRSVAQAEENAGAIAKGPLTAEQLAEIDQLPGR
ncbi:hypothetical protein GCM10023084_01510 [Streptomyces lacrimifluminis]|uniref:Uncharacterized protein n=1 Tax=Streptomyces lacrimifluminis TaxID=1500077 RepID=A0A917NSL0_9ACTN|nr:hypothetical protein GCM10012282_16590 [Streptomyces lacrimifluminis]